MVDTQGVLDSGVDVGDADGVFVVSFELSASGIGGAVDVTGAEAAAGESH